MAGTKNEAQSEVTWRTGTLSHHIVHTTVAKGYEVTKYHVHDFVENRDFPKTGFAS